MKTATPIAQNARTRPESRSESHPASGHQPSMQITDTRMEALAQRKLQVQADASFRTRHQTALQAMLAGSLHAAQLQTRLRKIGVGKADPSAEPQPVGNAAFQQKATGTGPAPVQRLVAVASDKIEKEKEKSASDANVFDNALVSGGWEARKLTGGPIKLIFDTSKEEIENKSELSIVGHGTGKGMTGDIPIASVVNYLAANDFGKLKDEQNPGAGRTATLVLFSCLSGSKLFNAESSDAQIYKQLFAGKKIDVTILAPKGIAITDMDSDKGRSKVTSISQAHTAAYSANGMYGKIRGYWSKVALADSVNKKLNFRGILDLFSKDTQQTSKAENFTKNKSTLATYSHPATKLNAAYGEQLKQQYGLDSKEKANALPKTLLALIQQKPQDELQQKILDAVSDFYSSEKNKFRLNDDEMYILPLFSDPLDDLKNELTAMKPNYGGGDGVVENQTGNEVIPVNIVEYCKKLSNKGNWLVL